MERDSLCEGQEMTDNVHEAFRSTLDAIFPRLSAEQRLRSIVRAYDDCKDDPKAKVPTILALLIEAARENCGEGTQRAFKEDAAR